MCVKTNNYCNNELLITIFTLISWGKPKLNIFDRRGRVFDALTVPQSSPLEMLATIVITIAVGHDHDDQPSLNYLTKASFGQDLRSGLG